MKIFIISKYDPVQDIEELKRKTKDYSSGEDFEAAHSQDGLMDLSNYNAHRMGRVFSSEKSVSVADILKDTTPYGYLSTIRQSAPRTFAAMNNGKSTITVYRAVPPDKKDMLKFLNDEKSKILRMGKRGRYPFMSLYGFNNTSDYYEFLDGEIQGLQTGSNKSSFKYIDDHSLKIGDYVALDRQYAVLHGESVVVGEQKWPWYVIISKTLPKKDVIWGEADWNEWAYSPQSIRDEYPNGLRGFYDKHKVIP